MTIGLSIFSKIFFIFVIVILVSIGLLYSLKYSLSDNNHFAFAQSTNATSIFVPSNMNRVEVTLQNDSNGSVYSLLIQIITAIASAAGAIGGGLIASRYSHKKAMALETLRYDNETKKQKETEEKQQKQKEEYGKNVMQSTFYELREFSQTLRSIQDENYWTGDEKYTLKILTSRLENFTMVFLTIPLDTRLDLFSPHVLWSVHSAYAFFQAFTKAILLFIEDYNTHPTGNFRKAVQVLGPSGVKEIVDDAITELKNLLGR